MWKLEVVVKEPGRAGAMPFLGVAFDGLCPLNTPGMGDGSLSSVVSGLVRAQMGTSLSSTVTDDDLDRHVAELILKEAKKKAEQYGHQGVSAYLPQPEGNVPKTNKRFLSTIIRHTDDHNKSILRAQALSASEIRMERESQMRIDRRTRAEEAAAAERARRSRHGRGDSWDRERKRRERSWERYVSDEGEDRWRASKRRRDDEEEGERRGSHSVRVTRRDEQGSSRRRRHHEERVKRRRRRRRRASRSRSPDGTHERKSQASSSKRPRSHSPADIDDDESRLSRRERRRRSSGSPRPDGSSEPDTRSSTDIITHIATTLLADTDIDLAHVRVLQIKDSGPKPCPRGCVLETGSDLRIFRNDVATCGFMFAFPVPDDSPRLRDTSPNPPRSPSPGPRPPPGPPPPLPPPDDFTADSMDKYFDASYDPRLDVAPLVAPTVPATGLIDNTEFEGWDAMLELIKQRRVDKAERKRAERLGLIEKGGKDKKKSKSKVAGLGVAGMLAGSSEGGNGLMDIEYKKRGSVREWDLGKETPT
ncbi:hypothetical protein BGW80DRAFT_1309899 [Lactifluus volemus]|nr:hypothetical protein BGW80DRAFT_1309899 [Lactifluus volemus]